MYKLVYWLEYFVKFLLLLTILQGLALALVYLVKKTGKAQTNHLLAALLLFSSFTLTHQLLYFLGTTQHNPRLNFLPIYFSFALGPTIFYFVKSATYYSFTLSKKDIKHFILPIAQFSFFVFTFNKPSHDLLSIKNSILFPYYGVFEKFIFVFTFLAYLYFANNFVKDSLNKPKQLYWQTRNAFRLKILLKITYYLFLLHASILLTDPILYKLFKIDINNLKIISWLHYLTFAATVVWYGIWAYAQEYLIFIEGPILKPQSPAQLYQNIETITKREKHYRDNALKPSMYLKILPNINIQQLENNVLETTGMSFQNWLNKIRYSSLLGQSNQPTPAEIYNAGFPSLHAFTQIQKNQ